MASHKIKIAARIRPRLEHEVDDEAIQVTHTPGGLSCISVPNPRDVSQIFNFPYALSIPLFLYSDVSCHSFSSCYDQDSTQEEIFERDARPLIDVVYSGVVCISFIDNMLDLSSADSNYFRIWCHLFWKDPHDARNQSPPWSYPASCGGLFSYLLVPFPD